MDRAHSGQMSASIHLSGHIDSADFPQWIDRHARKLGIAVTATRITGDELHLDVTGPEDMVQALALGCSLGPASVLVDSMTLIPRNAT